MKRNGEDKDKKTKMKVFFKFVFLERGFYMSRNRSIMSENLKEEIAKELGVYEQVKRDGGWENVSSKDCGNIVTKAIEIANRSVK